MKIISIVQSYEIKLWIKETCEAICRIIDDAHAHAAQTSDIRRYFDASKCAERHRQWAYTHNSAIVQNDPMRSRLYVFCPEGALSVSAFIDSKTTYFYILVYAVLFGGLYNEVGLYTQLAKLWNFDKIHILCLSVGPSR